MTNKYISTKSNHGKTVIVSLASPTVRLRIIRALVGAGPDDMTPGALSAMLDVRASTLSFHFPTGTVNPFSLSIPGQTPRPTARDHLLHSVSPHA